MRLRVGFGRALVYNGEQYRQGDEFDVPEESAPGWLSSGLVLPADGIWPADTYAPPTEPPAPVSEGASTTHETCDPGPKPAGVRSMQTCPIAGCPCLTWKGKCKAHARSNTQGDRYRDSYTDGSALRRRWANARARYLGEHPWCENEAAHPQLSAPRATEVDHIDGLGLQGPRAFHPDNWQSLCASCHSRKTASESFGR
jgi:5-methylcytosine-specific restriction protein A